VLSSSNTTDQIIAERIANGNFYTVNDQYERTYTITDLSGTGEAQEVKFPNSGVLYADGELDFIYEGTTQQPTYTTYSAPSVSLSTIAGSGSNRYYRVTLSGGTNTTYYYKIENGNKVQFSNVSTNQPRIYVAGSGTGTNRFSVSSSLSSTNDQVKIYFYIGNDDKAPATELTITRTGTGNTAFSNKIVKGASIKVPTGQTSSVTKEAALVMWSSGRVEGTKYEFFWFGPMRGRLDPWLNTTAKPRPSYYNKESREHYEIGYAPYGLWGVQDKPGEGGSTTESNAARGAATVARCIREYDNVTTVSE
jgi:hypothetical protein